MVAYSFKKQFIKPIQVGLSSVSLSFDPPPKRQTIRAIGKRRHARPGEILQLYYGMRTKQCMSIGVAICVSVCPIEIRIGKRSLSITLDGFPAVRAAQRQMAIDDGFADEDEMLAFWQKEHRGVTDFKGVLIRWEPIR